MKQMRVLLVDDEENILSALSRSLIDEPFEIVTAISAEIALNVMEGDQCEIVISDERMPGMDGAAFLSIVKTRWPQTIRIMLTGHASIEATMRAVNNGEIYRFFTKPWDENMLKLSLRSAAEKYELEDENRRLLKTVKRQSQTIRTLEKQYPGISELKLSSDGAYELPDISDEEVEEIISICNR